MWPALALALATAAADDGREGLLLPGASPMEAGGGHVGATGGAFRVGSADLNGATAGLQLGVGLTDRIGIVGFAGHQGLTPNIDALQHVSSDPAGWHLVSLRASLLEQPGLRFSVMATQEAHWGRPLFGSVGLGFALQAGALDLSIPSVGGLAARMEGREYGVYPTWFPAGADLGLTARFGEHHGLRFSPVAVMWQIRSESIYVDLSASAFQKLGGAVNAGVRL